MYQKGSYLTELPIHVHYETPSDSNVKHPGEKSSAVVSLESPKVDTNTGAAAGISPLGIQPSVLSGLG